jgi:hypothetical protein
MKNLLTISTLVFTLMFSSTSFAGWTKVTQNSVYTHYVDFERIRRVDGYVYFWNMFDYPKINEFGNFSVQRYDQGDCKLFRYKMLSVSAHKKPMGGGTGEVHNVPDKEWTYPPPSSSIESILKSVCSR